MRKIGIYGGSFNPPHTGHILAAEQAIQALKLDELLFVPAGTPPHKALAQGSPDAAERLELLRLATAHLEKTRVSEIECSRPGPSYSFETLETLREVYQGAQLYLLMGTDMFLSLHSWRHPERICRCAEIVLASRVENEGATHAAIQAQAERLRREFDAKVQILDNDFIEISSFTVRRMLAFRCAEHYLDPVVLARIQEKGLYGTKEDLRNLPFSLLKEKSLALHKEKRVAHVIGCSETAAALARRWGADETDAARAGILHDVTKALDGREQLLLCEKYGIMTDTFEQTNTKLLHAKTGSAVAREIFGENDAVCNAIYWHTTGKADMSLLEKILYLADYIEPNRAFEGVERVRALAFENLDAALLLGLNMAMEELQREGKPLGQRSLEAREYLLQRKG
jgi:nicotinate-nucleotide adenylyltransferase